MDKKRKVERREGKDGLIRSDLGKEKRKTGRKFQGCEKTGLSVKMEAKKCTWKQVRGARGVNVVQGNLEKKDDGEDLS